MKRSGRGMRARSAKRVAARADEMEVTETCFRRDGYRCQLVGLVPGHNCYGTVLTPHHLRKQSQGGTWTLDNLLSVCAVPFRSKHSPPLVAWGFGLVVRTGETSEDAWRRMRTLRP
jgi:hypothetical protein